MMQTGVYLCISAIMSGHVLYSSYGFLGFWIGLIIGSIILFLCAAVFIEITMLHRKVLIEIVELYFGKTGAKFAGFSLGISLLGWFSIQHGIKADGLLMFFPNIPKNFLVIAMGTLMTLSVMKGMGYMSKFSNVTIPFVILIMIIAMSKVYKTGVPIPAMKANFTGIGFVISCALAGVIDIPTFFKDAATKKDAHTANAIVFLVILPFMAIVGGAFAFFGGATEFVPMLLSIGGPYWKIFCLLFILFAGWTTNNGNLYSATIAMEPCIKAGYAKRTAILGVIGTAIGCLPLGTSFEEILSITSITLAPLGGAIMARFLSKSMKYVELSNKEKARYICLMLIGTAIGIISHIGVIKIFGYGFIDGFLFVFISALIMEKFCEN